MTVTHTAAAPIPLVDLAAQLASIRPQIDRAIARVLEHGGFIQGPEVKAFEAAFADFCGARHAIGIASGTAAIHLALEACDVRGGEVITSPHTFAATAEAIVHAGARPVLADIDPLTFNLDPEKAEAAITPRTRAIMPVHLYGRPAPMARFAEICRGHGLKLIEDAAQAHGASIDGRRAGALGDAACFSFYPGKNLGAFGDAGAVATNDDDIAARVRMLRDHGRKDKYEHSIVGYGERLDALQAAILAAKLPHLADWNERRRCAAAAYTRLLTPAGVICPADVPGHVYHLYVIRSGRRDALLAALKAEQIGAGVHYPIPLHLQPAFAWLGYACGSFPEAERAAAEVVSLPLFPELTEAQIERVAGVCGRPLN